MELDIASRLSTLGHPQRLALFRLLMRRYPDRVPATELAQALALKPNTLSTYVAALLHAGLVTQERRGTSLRYAIDMNAARQTTDFLLLECCGGRPEFCMPHSHPMPQRVADRRYNVLFVCTGNTARSILAEAILRGQASTRFAAHSAGTKPRLQVNPTALAVLERHGHQTSALRSKTVNEFREGNAPAFDFVFTVCDQAANEGRPVWSGQPINAHWGMPDPVGAEFSDRNQRRAFEQAYEVLRRRITAFTSLRFASLDRIALQGAVDDIARTDTEVPA